MTDEREGSVTRRQVLAGLTGLFGVGAAGAYYVQSTDRPGGQTYPATFTARNGTSEGLGISLADHPILGSMDADCVLFAWSDYQCPYCKQFDENTLESLAANEVSSGALAVVFFELPLLGEASLTASVVSKAVWRTVAADDPDAWGRFHRYVLGQQDGENSGWASQSNLFEYAATVDGVPRGDVERLVRTDREALERAVKRDAAVAFEDLGLDRGAPLFALSNPRTGEWLAIRGAQPYETFQTAITRLDG